MMKRLASQKGTTLLELIIVMGISAMIMSGVVGLVSHEFRGTAIAKTSVTAAHEIGNASRWLSQDGMMAESTNLVEGANPVNCLNLTWIERYEFVNIPHSSSYYLEGTRLRRDYDGTVVTVAQDISKIEFSQTGRVLTVSLSCGPPWGAPEGTVQKTYRVYLRAAEEGYVW